MPVLAFAEQWRLHPTFDGKIERIIDTPDYTYVLSNSQQYLEGYSDNGIIYRSLFKYDKDAEDFTWMSQQNGLTESVLQRADYNVAKKYLSVIYDSGNIDLIYEDGKVVNIPGLKLADASYEKSVNGVTFFSQSNEIYLATNFGIIIIDDEVGEIKKTINLRKKVNTVARFGDKVFFGDSTGLYVSDYKDINNVDNFKKIDEFENVKSMTPFGDRLYVLYGDGWAARMPYLKFDDNNDIVVVPEFAFMIMGIEQRKDGLLISNPEAVFCLDKDYTVTIYLKESEDFYKHVGGWSGTDFWIDNGRDGISLKNVRKNESGVAIWTIKNERLFPNASSVFKSTCMTYHPTYGLIVRNHGIDNRFTNYDVDTPDLICSYKNLEWTPRSTTYLSPSNAFLQWNPGGIAIDSNNTNHIYSGSVFHGLMRLDISDPSKSLRIGREGDVGNGLLGFVAVQRNFTEWKEACFFSVPMFDNYGNLWTSWYDYDLDKVKQDALEFWYWTPEDRAASKDAASFRPLKRIKIAGAPVGTSQMLIPLRSSSYRNILMYCPGTWEGLPVFIDHKGTLDNQNDDERVDIKEFTDQDGTNVNFAYIMSVYEDTSNGLVWLGLDRGVINFRPSEIMKTEGRVNRIKVSRNDGTNLADYLLDGVSVNCIVPDNSGRKWFGTGGGGIVVTSADGTEVLRTYTTDNSELPDNTVYSICYNPENNSMMISTDKGLAELFLSTSAGGDSDNKALIYPNPVRPDYFGYVTIEGLADNALVKIVDSGGNLIKEVGFAAGGEARWDVTNLNSKRVPGGVYYVLASGAPDGDGFSTVGKILVVN